MVAHADISLGVLAEIADSIGVRHSEIKLEESYIQNGGTSLKAIRVALRLRKIGITIEAGELISAGSLCELVSIIEGRSDEEVTL